MWSKLVEGVVWMYIEPYSIPEHPLGGLLVWRALEFFMIRRSKHDHLEDSGVLSTEVLILGNYVLLWLSKSHSTRSHSSNVREVKCTYNHSKYHRPHNCCTSASLTSNWQSIGQSAWWYFHWRRSPQNGLDSSGDWWFCFPWQLLCFFFNTTCKHNPLKQRQQRLRFLLRRLRKNNSNSCRLIRHWGQGMIQLQNKY